MRAVACNVESPADTVVSSRNLGIARPTRLLSNPLKPDRHIQLQELARTKQVSGNRRR